jgi:hypothetical protein
MSNKETKQKTKASCSQCGRTFDRHKDRIKEFNFCSGECYHNARRKGGVLYKRVTVHCTHCGESIEKYEFSIKKHNFCNRTCQHKACEKGGVLCNDVKKTLVERYGVECSLHTASALAKTKETMLERYGIERPCEANSTESVKEKKKNTYTERYGADHYFKTEEFRERASEAWTQNYGVDNPMRSCIVQAKIAKTNIERYGVVNVFSCPEKQRLIRETLTKRYGVDNPLKCEAIRKKSNETKARNHSNLCSYPENKVYELLCLRFGTENVVRQALINGWSIDFYVKSIKSYIQVDGNYWHGLDRSIEVIRESKSSHDRSIYATMLRDKQQNDWFSNNKINLVRFTESDVLSSDFTTSM